MKRLLLALCLSLVAKFGFAITPYSLGSKLAAADLATQLTAVETKLKEAGFTVVGRHTPKGLAQSASLVVTDAALLEALRGVGGSSIAAAGIRVGVQADGTVSYTNPGYWHRAFVRSKFASVEAASNAVADKLKKALGEGKPMGGDVPADDLATYRYKFGMERFDSDNSLVATHASFDEALATVRNNLDKKVADTAKVYEVVMPERKSAVLGVAMNNADSGEGWWVNKIDGSAYVAALPYEIFIVDNKVYALYARFRIALGWPELGMGQFMRIINAPNAIQDIMTKVASKP